MPTNKHWDRVTALPAFERYVLAATRKSTLFSLPALEPIEESERIDWNEGLFIASLVSIDSTERAHDGALRIAQSCIQDPDSTSEQRTAARFILERLGNTRSVRLALKQGLIREENIMPLSGPLELDLTRRQLSLTVFPENGDSIQTNEFQRQFWMAAKYHQWVSVSAPTSTGKSYIVKRWLLDRILSHERFVAVYLVPTRALVKEVSKDLEEILGNKVEVFTLPWDTKINASAKQVFVLTQERLHILQQKYPDLNIDLVFIDEAQKLGDDSRGILLQRVLDEVTMNNSRAQVLFASPLSSNPGLLLDGVVQRSIALTSEIVTVNQDLIHVNQRFGKPKVWDAEIVVGGESHLLGSFTLPVGPTMTSERLSMVAVALGKQHTGNVVYVNGPGEAETVSGQIYEALGIENDISADEDIAALRELIEKTIHPKFQLNEFLKRGVAFHYGNMPLLVREEVERLFRIGTLHYLVCTSTLLEGVNLPCQNLFVRGPRKGNNHPMSVGDFWNLAGRAGRWGLEFQGNIVCVDTKKSGIWRDVPFTRKRQPIERATDNVLSSFDKFIGYINELAPLTTSKDNATLESLFSVIATRYQQQINFNELKWLVASETQRQELVISLERAMANVTLPVSLIEKHAGISPLSIQRLADFFATYDQPLIQLALPALKSENAVESYKNALTRINTFLGGGFTDLPGRQFSLALLFVDWMQGRPLSLLISKRINYLKRHDRDYKLSTEIRSVMTDVEQYARFQAPLYLTCYVDTLREVHPELFSDDQNIANIPDIAMMLELGVSRTTELSMMSLGASRTSAVSLSEHIADSSLSPDDCIQWLEANDLESIGVPTLVRLELEKVVERYWVRKRSNSS